MATKTDFPAELPVLTSLRFLLAAGVVLFHYHLTWSVAEPPTGLIERARLGVDVFFILSGFILTHVYQAQWEQGRYRHGAFLVARFARVYPMHLLMLAFMVAMVTAAGLIGAEFDRKTLSPMGLFQSLLMIHAWFPTDVQNGWNGPAWSLSAEWFAYIAFPAFAWIGLKLKDRPLALIAIAGASFVALDLFYQAVFGKILPHAEDAMGMLRIIPEFLYGVGLYRLGQALAPSRRAAVFGAVVTAAAFFLLMHFSADDRLIVAAAGPLVLALALLTKAKADAPLARPWMVLAGEVSYALYLVHLPVMIAWKGVVAELTDQPSNYIMGAPEVTALFGLTLASAYVAHFLFETPARKWIRSRAEAFRPAPRTLAGAPGTQPPDY